MKLPNELGWATAASAIEFLRDCFRRRQRDRTRLAAGNRVKKFEAIAEDLLPLITPGEILQEEFLEPLDLSASALAKALHVPANRISAIIKNQRGITADTALRLARYFGNTPQFWMNLQQNYELARAKRENWTEIQHQVRQRPAA